MPRWYETVTELSDEQQRAVVRRRRYGIIEVLNGELRRIVLRPLPSLAGPLDLAWGEIVHNTLPGDRAWLYFNQPRGLDQFLSLKFLMSTRQATLATLREALEVLDEIAAIKRSDAIVCDAANWRISDRLLARGGWQSHKPQRSHRNYIKRFSVQG